MPLKSSTLHKPIKWILVTLLAALLGSYLVSQLVWPIYGSRAQLILLIMPEFYSPEQAYELAKASLLEKPLHQSLIPQELRTRVDLRTQATHLGMSLFVTSATPLAAQKICRAYLNYFLSQQADHAARLANSSQKNYSAQRAYQVDLLESREKKFNSLGSEEIRRYLLSVLRHRELTYQHSKAQRWIEMQPPLWVVLEQPHKIGRIWTPALTTWWAGTTLAVFWLVGTYANRRFRY